MHIAHFVSDKIMAECDVMCFTETHCNSQTIDNIGKYLNGWCEIHKFRSHGLAICYNSNTVELLMNFRLDLCWKYCQF